MAWIIGKVSDEEFDALTRAGWESFPPPESMLDEDELRGVDGERTAAFWVGSDVFTIMTGAGLGSCAEGGTSVKRWTVINQHDGNETFEAEGDNYGEAACDALSQLGWAIVVPDPDGDEDEEADGKGGA